MTHSMKLWGREGPGAKTEAVYWRGRREKGVNRERGGGVKRSQKIETRGLKKNRGERDGRGDKWVAGGVGKAWDRYEVRPI